MWFLTEKNVCLWTREAVHQLLRKRYGVELKK